MKQYLVFRRDGRDAKALEEGGYPWIAFLFAPLWAFSKRLTLHGAVLSVLYGLCAWAMLGSASNGGVVGATIALWLGTFTAHNASDWLASSLEKQGYRMTDRVEASSVTEALGRSRTPKRHRVLLENMTSKQLSEMLSGEHSPTDG